MRRSERDVWGGWDAKALGERIRRIRRELSLSQLQFARLLGPPFDQPMVSRYESGRCVPPLPALIRLAAAGGPEWTLDRLAIGLEVGKKHLPRLAQAVAEMEAAFHDSRAALTAGDHSVEVDLRGAGRTLQSAAISFPIVRHYQPHFDPSAPRPARTPTVAIDPALVPLAHPEATTAHRLADNAMAPGWPKGTLVLVDHALRDERSLQGCLVAVRHGGRTIVRWCRLADEHVVLRAENPASPDTVLPRHAIDQLIVGMVIWCGVRLPKHR